jgi:parallel beta-helix repeat protein
MATFDPRGAAMVAALAAWTLAARAADIHVPGDQPTIQQGIDAASPGDRVLVAPGTYAEHIDFEGKDIGVESTAGAAVTTIDGTYTGIVVTFVHGEGPAAVLRGFTIMRGAAGLKYTLPNTGGGIRIESHSSPTIEDNDIHHNLAHDGGGIAVSFSSPTIRNNRIHDNRVYRGHWGGGIFVSDVGSTVIEHNLIDHNRAPFGAGLAVHGFLGGTPLIARNVITFNQARYDAGGLEVWIHARIVDNLIHGNVAPPGAAAGVRAMGFLNTDNDIVFTNNTIADNRGDDLRVQVEGGQVVFQNTIVRTSAGAFSVECDQRDGGTAVFDRSLVFATNGATITGHCDLAAGGLLTVDPRFTGPAHAHPYSLQADSPAIDGGDNAAVAHVKVDLAGRPRIQGARADLGAYEHPATD